MDRFLFRFAGKFAPKEIQAFIERFRKAPEGKRGEKPLLYVILGDGTPPYKFAKAEVKYTDDPSTLKEGEGGGEPYEVAYRRGLTCSNCSSLYVHVTSDTLICDRMRGVVKREGWCNRWNPPASVDQYRKYQDAGRRVTGEPSGA
jgi:hypothetical protein